MAWLAGGWLAALLTVGLPGDLLQVRRAIAAGGPVGPVWLAGPGVPVRNYVIT